MAGRLIYTRYILTLLLTLLSGTAFAVDVPSGVEPSRVQEQIAPQPAPKLPEGGSVSGSEVTVEAPEGAAEAKFILKEITIQGMTVYKKADVAPLYKGMIGQTVSLVEIYKLAETLTAKYRNAGYILTQVIVPPQTIDDGRIRLQAVEGYIEHIYVYSKDHGDTPFLAPYDFIIQNSKPLNAKVLERYLLLINDQPGISAKSVLSPSPKTPGASVLSLMIEKKRYDVSLQMDNRGSRYMGPFQTNASTRVNNALGFHEGISLQVATTPASHPNRELDYANVGISRALGEVGAVVNVNGSVTSTAPGYALKQFDVRGTAHNYSAGITYPFVRSREENLSGTLKFDYLDTVRTDNLATRIEDRVRAVRLSGLYQFADRHQGVNTLTGEISRGLNILNTKPAGSPDLTRADGDPIFFKATFDVARIQRLTDIFDLAVSTTGQWSANPLLASEEFGVGGAAYGSAYDSSEITGRHGLAGRAELRATNPVYSRMDKLQLYGFYDVGQVWDPQNAVPKDQVRSLASTGVGVRTEMNKNVSASCEVAVPLTRKVETEQNNDSRFFGTLAARF